MDAKLNILERLSVVAVYDYIWYAVTLSADHGSHCTEVTILGVEDK
jgi:hypothetical protein